MAKLNTFSLYLGKPCVTSFEDILTQNAVSLIKAGVAKKSTSTKFGDGAVLYTFPGNENTPKWVNLLKPTFSPPDNIFSQSPCAVVIFKQGKLYFALTFSYAHSYLDNAKTEAEFGLKVAINAISDEKLRSVERSNIGAAIRDFAQAAGQRDLRSFGFDDALDLIRKVSGRASNAEFADMVTGARSLRFSKKIELKDVPTIAAESAKLFKSKAYKNTGFEIIDFLSPVLDTDLEAQLDNAMVSAIIQGSDEFEITIPSILPESAASFKFQRAGINDFYPDLSLELYREGLGDKLKTLTTDLLKNHDVIAYAADNNDPIDYWSIHHSLVGSLNYKGERYAINEGFWYKVSDAIRDTADKKFASLYSAPDKKLRPLKKIIEPAKKGNKQKVSYQSEETYNAEIAKETGYLLLDQRLVQIREMPGPGVEVCDLIDIAGKRFIHIKKSSRQSSVLSHLFKQGGNSAQLLRKFEGFEQGLTEIVKKHYGDSTAEKLKAALKDKAWTVEFQIADYPRKDGKHNIPFFSKLTLRDEARTIEAMGYKVKVGFITQARIKTSSNQSKTLSAKKAA